MIRGLLALLLLAGTAQADVVVRRNGSVWARVDSAGQIRMAGRAVGSLRKGVIRHSGAVVGRIGTDGTIRQRGATAAKLGRDGAIRRRGAVWARIGRDGTIRIGGRTWGRARGGKRDIAMLIFFLRRR
jgi:hypothetical protein